MEKRKATKLDILETIQRLERAIPKPKGMTELAIDEYEAALDGVSFEALNAARIYLLRKSKFFPSTSEFFQACQRFEVTEKPKPKTWDEDQKKRSTAPMTHLTKANEVQRLQGIEQFMNALPQRDQALPAEAYNEALKDCSFLAIQMTVNRILLKRFGWERRHMPWPDDLVQMVRDMEHELLTRENDGPMLTKALVESDSALRARLDEVGKLGGYTLDKPWQGLSFDDAVKPSAQPSPEQPTQPSDEERLQRLKDQANEPIHASEALLRTLRNPMNPDRG